MCIARRCLSLVLFSLTLIPFTTNSAPTVFPTGTTLYNPDLSWNGYTVLSILDTHAVLVIDMNGRVVKRWEGFDLASGGPARILPNGQLIAPTGAHPGHQEATALIQQDFDGQELWSFNDSEMINIEDESISSSRQHHDWQRADFPAGYYSPEFTPTSMGSPSLLLTHTSYRNPEIMDTLLEDDRIIEISADGEVLWQWRAGDHIDEFGFDDTARNTIRTISANRTSYDWSHINSATYVGPNQWYNNGDKRFSPENIIISSRHANFIAIIDRQGTVVWRIGPDFSASAAEQKIRQIIGQHHAHLIPPGLPGAGNMLIFDNGGSSGYGAPSPIAPTGLGIYARSTSRILEINPLTLEVVWTYTHPNFFSTNISGMQRLPNGNTLITEGAPGRIFEVTEQREIVWEYMNAPGENGRRSNAVYRAYRLPYEWIPQLPTPTEKSVMPPAPGSFILP